MTTANHFKNGDLVDVLNDQAMRIAWGMVIAREERLTTLQRIVPKHESPFWAFELLELSTERFLYQRLPGLNEEDGLMFRSLLFVIEQTHEQEGKRSATERSVLSLAGAWDVAHQLMLRGPERMYTLSKVYTSSETDAEERLHRRCQGLLGECLSALFMTSDVPPDIVKEAIIKWPYGWDWKRRETALGPGRSKKHSPHLELIRETLDAIPEPPEKPAAPQVDLRD